jgi:HlyD family secretion protein
MRKRNVLLWMSAAGALVALGGWTVLRGHGDVEYRTAPVDRGTVAYSVSATGTPNAVVTVQVGSQVSGNIMALYADFNTKVKKGQLVARIDPQVFQAKVDQTKASLDAANASVVNARASVQKAQAELADSNAGVANAKALVLKAKVAVQNAKINLDRQLALFSAGVTAQQDRDTAQATYDSTVADEQAAEAQQQAAVEKVASSQADLEVARTQLSSALAQVQQWKASLAQAQLDLAHTYITAPVDGTVISRNVDVGQTVAASLQAPTLFEIAQDLTKMQVDTNVSEADIGRVRVGQPATFTVDAYPGQIFRGQVSQIRKAPINVQNVVTYDAVISVANPDLKLFPGMTANVKILVASHPDVLRIPNAALRYRPADSVMTRVSFSGSGQAGRRGQVPESTVWVLGPNGKPAPVEIKTGLSDGNYTEVTGGDLKQGEQVIVAAFSEGGGTSASAGGPRGRFGF